MSQAFFDACEENLDDGVELEQDPTITDPGDSHFQLPIRRHCTRRGHVSTRDEVYQDAASKHSDLVNDSGSDSEYSQVILTPEATSSDEEETEEPMTQELDVLSVSHRAGKENTLFPEQVGGEVTDALKKGLSHGTSIKGLSHGTSIEHYAFNTYAPLVFAIMKLSIEEVRFWLVQKANVHRRVGNVPPIVHAVLRERNAPQVIQLLMDYGATPHTISCREGFNALHFAAMYGRLDAVDFLASKGMDLERMCSEGRTALLLAAEKGHILVAMVLLVKGADLRHKSADGKTALVYAASNGHVETVRCFLDGGLDVNDCDGAGISALSAASKQGHVEVVRLLLDNGADINSVSYEPEGFTPIMAAAVAGHTETVQLLLDRGADLTIRDCDNTTLLDATMLAGHRDTVQVLLKAIGGPNYPLESIALDIAVADSIEAITSRMLAAGISYATTDREHHQEKSAARISEVLRQGGRLVRPKAFTNMVYVALHEENVEVVHSLSRFFDRRTNTHLPNGDTPLTFAVRRRNTALVEELLDWGHDISIESRCPTDENYTPLLQALVDLDEDCERDTSVVDVLVDSKRCKLMAGKDARSTPFDYVLSHYSRWTNGVALPLLSRMWRSVEHIQDDRSDDGSTLMHSAVWYGRTDLISSLLSKGADINAKDKRGCTPFLLECQSNAKILRILISHGADPHVKDTDGQGALHAAAGAGHVGVITQLLSLNLPLDLHDNNGYTPFSWAVICGQEDAALHLHHKGASIPTNTFRHGRTLLHTAASLCMEKLVPVLYSNGSFNMNAQDDMGFTPLALACRNGSIDLVSALYVRSAEIRIAHYAHDSPPHLMLAAGNDAVAEFLLKRCADAFARGREGDMPLHLAAEHGNPVTTELLLEMLGANIEALDGMGRTPLCVCAGAFIARILLDHGANINFADSKGWTALHYAVAREDVDTFNVLVGAGASLEARTLDDGLDVYDRIDRLEEGVAGPFKAILRLPY